MLRSAAVRRINRDLGYRPDGWAREGDVISCLQEAQKNFEKGKTLPRFLLAEDQPLTLLVNTHSVAYPTGFLRISDDNPLHFFPTGSTVPTYLQQKFYSDAVIANITASSTEARAPSVYVLRKGSIDFITTANQQYNLLMDYYKAADLLTSDIENQWLADEGAGAEWLIGEAGYRMAVSLKDQSAMQSFDAMRTSGRAACFGELVTQETEGGPLQMGANN